MSQWTNFLQKLHADSQKGEPQPITPLQIADVIKRGIGAGVRVKELTEEERGKPCNKMIDGWRCEEDAVVNINGGLRCYHHACRNISSAIRKTKKRIARAALESQEMKNG